MNSAGGLFEDAPVVSDVSLPQAAEASTSKPGEFMILAKPIKMTLQNLFMHMYTTIFIYKFSVCLLSIVE